MPGDDELTVVDLVPDRRGTGIDVGDQVPFRAPLGASVAAFLRRRGRREVAHRRAARGAARSDLELVDAVRARGYAVELTGTVDARINEMLAQIGGRFADGSGDGGDPARGGSARCWTRSSASFLGGLGWFHPVQLDPDATYQVGTMSAPVFGPVGDVVLVLAVRGLPERVTGSEVQRLGVDRVTAANEVTEASGGRRPAGRAGPRRRRSPGAAHPPATMSRCRRTPPRPSPVGRLAAAAVLVVIVVLAAGCGSSSPATGTGAGVLPTPPCRPSPS